MEAAEAAAEAAEEASAAAKSAEQRRQLVATAAVTTSATIWFKQCRLIDAFGQSILTSLAELGDGAAGRAGDSGKIRAF